MVGNCVVSQVIYNPGIIYLENSSDLLSLYVNQSNETKQLYF